MKKYSFYIFLLLGALLMGSCSDHNELEPIKGNIEEAEGSRVSIFHLRDNNISEWNKSDDVRFTLVDPERQLSYEFNGSILANREYGRRLLTCRLNIGETSIADGIYYLSIEGVDLPEIGFRKVRFADNIGTEDDTPALQYSDLEGSGTETDPYIIASDGDFLIMLSYLLEDTSHAYGRYFLQTRSFELPRRSQIIDGKMWAAVTFSGHYDGGGHRLRNLIYQGGSDPSGDSGIGLFKELYSASIANVTVTGALLTNVASDAGIIAGRASGTCLIENVTVDGTIVAAGSNIGGIIGSSKDKLTMKDITVNSLTISTTPASGACLGMAVGYHENGDISIDGFSNPDHIFSLSGENNVGGLIGKVYAPGKSVSIARASVRHSVDSESASVKIIHGATNVGGIVGHLSEVNNLMLEDVQVMAPVTGENNVGGLAGYCGKPSIAIIRNCQLSSVVSGGENVGGFFGEVALKQGGKMEFTGTDNGSRLVVKSSASAEISGNMNVGGIIGYVEGNNGKISLSSQVEIALNVSGLDRVGGAVGSAHNVEITSADRLNFTSATMKVTAKDKCAGGVAGYGSGVSIIGSLQLDPLNSIPDAAQIPMTFHGVVTGPTEAGGIIGVMAGGTVKGMATSAGVTAQASTAGGIAGKASGTIEECAFNGSLACPKNQGGIVGFCTEASINVSKCINYAHLSSAENLGGIMGYYYSQHDYYDQQKHSTLHIAECYNLGEIYGGLDAAGIIAHVEYSKTDSGSTDQVVIEQCGNGGKITGVDTSGRNSVGGVAGSLNCHVVVVKRCANTGKINSTGVQKTVGGVIGRAGCENALDIIVEECMNGGEVGSEAKSVKVGGVVGHLENSLALGDASRVRNCLNHGSITVDQKDDTGGIVGYVARFVDVSKNYSEGDIRYGNAIIGTHNPGTTFSHSDNYYLKGTGGGWPSSIAISDAQRNLEATFKGFDFTNVWYMTNGEGPALRQCLFRINK